MGETFIGAEKRKALERRMEELGIEERDIEEHFVRARGRGGQKVNKTSSCVHIRHIPTGIEVKCDKTRSREANRFFARRLLADKFEELTSHGPTQRQREAARIRKQKAKRASRARRKAGGDPFCDALVLDRPEK